MSNLEMMVEISKIARMYVGSLVCRRLLSGMSVIILLIVITGMLAGTLLVGGFYASYVVMLRHGVEDNTAMSIVACAIAAAIMICAALTRHLLRKMWGSVIPVPALPQVQRIASAFVDGFTESGHKEEHS